MMTREEYLNKRQQLMNQMKDFLNAGNMEQFNKLKSEVEELDRKYEEQATAQDFWDDMENSQKVLQLTKQLKDKVGAYEKLKQAWEDGLVLIDLANEENDESMLGEVKSAVLEITNYITPTNAPEKFAKPTE